MSHFGLMSGAIQGLVEKISSMSIFSSGQRSDSTVRPDNALQLSAYIWLVIILAFTCTCGCSRAQGLVGLWRTDTVRVSLTGDTNKTEETYQTAEFLTNGSFKITGVIKSRDGKEMAVPMGGTYTLLDTNHVRLELAPNSMRPDMKIPLTVSFGISGDNLEMDAITSSVVAEKTKYRRVTR